MGSPCLYPFGDLIEKVSKPDIFYFYFYFNFICNIFFMLQVLFDQFLRVQKRGLKKKKEGGKAPRHRFLQKPYSLA